MKTIILQSCIIICISLNAHAQSFKWVAAPGGGGECTGNSVTVDNSGNVVIGGYFQDTVDFDPGGDTVNLTSLGNNDAFISKLDSTGALVWVLHLGGKRDVRCNAVTVDHERNIYAIGLFQDTVDFDPGPDTFYMNPKQRHMYLCKYDTAGKLIWAKSFGGEFGAIYPHSLDLDNAGNLYIAGHFFSLVDFDPGPGKAELVSNGSSDAFVCKLDSTGGLIWAKGLGGEYMDRGFSVKADVFGNVISCGFFVREGDFDPGPGTHILSADGSREVFVSKLDSLGNFVWAKHFRNSYSLSMDDGYSVTSDDSGNVYTTGYHSGITDFDPGLDTFNLGPFGMFISKLDSAGGFVWAKSIGYTKVVGTGITLDHSNNIYATGYFINSPDFDPGLDTLIRTSYGGTDVFVVQLDNSGNYIDVKTFGGAKDDEARSITVDDKGNIYTTGLFRETVDFNPGAGTAIHTGTGKFNFFAHKMGKCVSTTYGIDTVITCNSYTWIDGNTYGSNNNTAEYIIPNAVGCDSVVTLNLTIVPLDTSVIRTNNTLTAVASGFSYQWLDCDNGYATVPGAIHQSFTPISNRSYAVMIIKNGCSDTSSCYNGSGVGIETAMNEIDAIVYPNPTTGQLHIDFPTPYANWTLEIQNIMGQTIFERQVTPGTSISTAIPGPAGMYLVLVRQDQHSMMFKIFKE